MNFLTKISNFTTLSKLPAFSSAFVRNISVTSARYCEEHTKKEETEVIDPSIDRTRFIPVETSIKYLKSAAYKETYGEEPVWVPYRRNHKGLLPPKKTRKTCIRSGKISTGNPCPLCRDEYLVLHEDNKELLKQFVSPHSGKVS
jgi:small subunit ribosomal protein S18b, mitochondrial